ncbi:MAG: HAD family phosphatase [Lachnospiraceae bacterium]|nr:HAD family phosphatase [Lachnospiraceae bacterium]
MDKSIRTIVFDVGMVLIDFCWDSCCRTLGFSEDVIQTFDERMIHSDTWERLDEGTITTEDAVTEFISRMPQYEKQVRMFWRKPELFVREYEYAAPMIAALKEKGYPVFLLSNYPYDMYRLHWPSFLFYPMVDGYVVSALERIKKPDPAIYQLLCERYGLKAQECLFVDDRQENVDAAIGVGMQAIRFTDYNSLIKKLQLEEAVQERRNNG